MNLLAIETATAACSVALLTADGEFSRHAVAPREHTALVFAQLDDCLTEAGIAVDKLDAVAFGHGPGAFTGVRIAATLAQGIALPRDLPVIAISTLAALAEGARRRGHRGRVVAALDARREEIYAATFEARDEVLIRLSDDDVLPPADLLLPAGSDWLAAGNAWAVYTARFAAALTALPRAADELPAALDVATLARHELAAGRSGRATNARPLYLRGAVD
ncbi:MAG: tRNA (adenosine(37)-N6)-threonylcarbamoyltransferase complex dimerization subunit type 1 TsaB [Gammaproteobacteria bacterium]